MLEEIKKIPTIAGIGVISGALLGAAALSLRVFSRSNSVLVQMTSVVASTIGVAFVFPWLKGRSDEALKDSSKSYTAAIVGQGWYAGIFASALSGVAYGLYKYASKIDNPVLNKLLFGTVAASALSYSVHNAFTTQPKPTLSTTATDPLTRL